MTKKILQDVVPSDDKKVVSARKRTRPPLASYIGKDEKEASRPPLPPRQARGDSFSFGGRQFPWRITAAVIAFLVFLYMLLTFLGGASISVTPKTEQISIEETVPVFSTEFVDGVRVSLVEAAAEVEKEVKADGVKEIEKQARGSIIVFNTYSSQPQRLVARTRFETPDGKIYRVPDAVVIPGTEKKDGKTVPGSLEIEVVADRPGEEFNISYTDFTIPGLKGTPLFEAFYARSKTEITGGFAGFTKVIPDEEYTATINEMEEELITTLREEAQAAVAEGDVLYDETLFFEFKESRVEDIEDEDKPVTLILEGTLKALALEKKSLNEYLVKAAFAEREEDEEGNNVEVSNIEELSLSLPNKNSVDPEDLSGVEFAVTGTGNFKWVYDEALVKEKLAGITKDEAVFRGIFETHFPYVVEAEVLSLSPFWAQSFPDDADKIKVTEKEGLFN